ncbi:hypothetical protein G9A89_010863 [Geosiphon pyriformis]|nr:hypothetical protein G9A89_010863 [Geosiphon pyriformis]
MWQQPQLSVTVVRHGETNSNLNRILQGHTDTKLNKVGREQAELVGRRLRKLRFDHIYSSDLSRAKKTAEAIAKHHPNTPFTLDSRLREKDFGKLNGLSIYQALEVIKKEERQWEDYGESNTDFTARLITFYNECVEKHLPYRGGLESVCNPKKNTHILLVTHGGTINKLIKEHLIHNLGFLVKNYMSIQHKPKNSSVSKFVIRRIIEDERNYSGASTPTSETSEASTIKIDRRPKSNPVIEGDIHLWSCVSHLAALGKRTRGDSQIDDYIH